MYYIYLITNNINGKKYIGQHKGKPNDSYFGSGTLILKAIEKYGKDNFTKTILATCNTREEADQLEKDYIKKYNAVDDPNFYNLAEGGTGGDGWRACHRWLKNNPEKAKQIYQKQERHLREWEQAHPKERQKLTENMLKAAHEWAKNNSDKVQEHMKKVNQEKEKWQKEHPQEHQAQIQRFIKAGSDANSKKVICLTTNTVYPSLSEAARQTNTAQPNISKVLQGQRKSAGKDPITGEKLLWAKYEDNTIQ